MTSLKMMWPANCKVVTQQYGNKSARYVSGYHTGIDIGCTQGSPIYAAHDGVVEFAGWNGAYGNEVRLRYNDAVITSYHHMSRIAATKGKTVSAGTVIGYIGSTGQSTGPHLHFEVRENGKAVNPNAYLGAGSTVPEATQSNNPLIPDAVETPVTVIARLADWVSEPKNWYRVGLILLGFWLVMAAVFGIAKTQGMAKLAANGAVSAVKKGVKSGPGKS